MAIFVTTLPRVASSGHFPTVVPRMALTATRCCVGCWPGSSGAATAESNAIITIGCGARYVTRIATWRAVVGNA